MSYEIKINPADLHSTEAISARVEAEVANALKHWQERITRVEVHLHDDNGPLKGGVDKRCTMEARLAKQTPVFIEHSARDMYEAITKAAGKLERAVRRHIERHDELKSAR